ncbi:unnamed protein product [Hermetia illucens]|uniref:Kazal-like domain-containing protein n=1 Tax=Hermetia illucens TaxID=343691 RepID=A0A7R8UPM8_HERIL|nr:uncharacterized protein LOC119652810 [Hermetia illucens]CAD7084596.1 unnamed protein product [Hermetia illucens]
MMILSSFFLSFLVILASAAKRLDLQPSLSTFPICAVRCAQVGSPVCAERNGVYKLFSTGCSKLSYYCNTGEEWKSVDMEYCYNNNIFPIVCTIQRKQYPVCAVNTSGGYRRFNNECQFLNYACVNYDQEWDRQMDCPEMVDVVQV